MYNNIVDKFVKSLHYKTNVFCFPLATSYNDRSDRADRTDPVSLIASFQVSGADPSGDY